MEQTGKGYTQKKPTLEDAWRRYAEYDYNANLQQARFSRTRVLILVLSVIAVALAIVNRLVLTQIVVPIPFLEEFTDFITFNTVSRILVILLPIALSALLTISSKFERGVGWSLMRSSADAIKREIYRFRTRSDIYANQHSNDEARIIHLANVVRTISERLMKTEVNQSGLQVYRGPLPPQEGTARGDDGFTLLSPDYYLQFRLEHQLAEYKSLSVEYGARIRRLHFMIISFGALGTLLAALQQEIWIAVTIAFVGAITSYIEFNHLEKKLMTYNQAATGLESIRIWWRAMPILQRDTQEMYDKLVKNVESILQSEQSNWAQNMQDALIDLNILDHKHLEDLGNSDAPDILKLQHIPDDTYLSDDDTYGTGKEFDGVLKTSNGNGEKFKAAPESKSHEPTSLSPGDTTSGEETYFPLPSDEELNQVYEEQGDEESGEDSHTPESPLPTALTPEQLATAGLELVEVEDSEEG